MKFLQTIPLPTLLLGLLVGGILGAALGYYGQCTSGMCPLTSTWWRGMLYGGFLGLLFAFSSGGERRVERSLNAPDHQPPVTSNASLENSTTATHP
ncbi:hypothetical protein BH20VER1_BH20VER1_03280 [soil metagenome]